MMRVNGWVIKNNKGGYLDRNARSKYFHADDPLFNYVFVAYTKDEAESVIKMYSLSGAYPAQITLVEKEVN